MSLNPIFLITIVISLMLAGLGCGGAELPRAEASRCIATEMMQTPQHPREDELQAFVDRSVKAGLPGMVMLVETSDGLWAGAAGMADIARGVPMGRCTPSRIGSVTKLFTATLIMRLADRDELDLDAPAADYLKSAVVADLPNGSRATVRQLLNHTSGIPSYTDDLGFGTNFLNDPDRSWNEDDLLDFVRGEDPLFAPGTSHDYSNTNYVLLGLVAEAATDRPLATLLRDEIFAPAELLRAHFDPDNIIAPGTARGYIDLYGGGRITESTNYLIGGYGDGGVVATAYDLLVFSEALFGGELLSQAALDEMTTWVPVPDPELGLTRYGLGLRYWETPHGAAYGHTGGAWGYLAELFYFPDHDTTVVLLVNGSLGELNEIFDEQVHNLLPELLF